MKKLLIAASLTAAALGATPLMAEPGHARGPRQAGAADGCAMAEHGQGMQRTAWHGERRAEMQKQMQDMRQDMRMRMGPQERSGAQEEHQH